MNKAEEHKLEQNDLIKWLTTFWTKLKTGQIIGPKALGVILLVIAAIVGWYWFSGQNKQAESKRWLAVNAADNNLDYKSVIDNNANTNAALVARMGSARIKLQNGLAELQVVSTLSGPTRADGIKNLEAAREEFLAIAKDLEKIKDKTLRTQALYYASQAELSLVGIVKENVSIANRDDASNHRGTVNRAIELLNEAAKITGESTEAGEMLTKRAKDLRTAEETGAKNRTNPSLTYLGILLNETLIVETPTTRPIEPTIIPPKIDDPIRTPTTSRTPSTSATPSTAR